jgi:CheY-like chemotaxis protein
MPNETVLVVDDNPRFTHALAEYMLLPLGYQVVHAPNGQKGLKMVSSHKPDLIMLDMNMPYMSGLEMLKMLRKNDYQAPVIFMTAEGSEHTAVEAFRLGVRDYLVKPFTMEELKRTVDAALQETRLARDKEKLTHDLIVSETVRKTIVTLSHYINNYLMVLTGNLSLVQDEIPQDLPNHAVLIKALKDSQKNANKIAAVLRILRRVTSVEQTTYHGQVKMIDIEAALKEELAKE